MDHTYTVLYSSAADCRRYFGFWDRLKIYLKHVDIVTINETSIQLESLNEAKGPAARGHDVSNSYEILE